MKYLISHFRLSPNTQTARDLLAALAGEAGFETFEETPSGLDGYAQCELLDTETLDQLLAAFPLADTEIAYSTEPAEDKDWNETWEQAGFEPIAIGNKCVIYDAKSELPANFGSPALAIGIDARMAFGTGTHETTRLMVERLLDLTLAGKRVLDCGCGTGILGIVAARCGASQVVAYDIDEWSVENARHNARLNGVENMEVLHGDACVLSHVSGVFDVVVANINRNILLSDMAAMHDVMAAEGVLVLSGFFESDVPQLVGKASELGLAYDGRHTSGQWCCISLHR